MLPVLFAVVVAGLGWTSYRSLEQSMKRELASKLETVRNATIEALGLWAKEVKAVVDVHAARPDIRHAAQELIELSHRSGGSRDALLASRFQASLRELMAPLLGSHGFAGWAVVDANGTFVAAGTDRNIGRHVPGVQAQLDEMASGRTIVTPPTLVQLLDQQPVALMIIGGPLRDEDGEPIGVFGFSLNPDEVYGRLLVVGRLGETGDTYAFDGNGLLISPSRFETQLRDVGILPDDPDVSSPLHIQIRDPGGNRIEGFEPTLALAARPFTTAAASAIGGDSGVSVEGYRDYRGVPVLGAWTWVPELGLGIASEIEVAEAYEGLDLLRTQFAIIVGVLAVAAIGMLLYSAVVLRLGREIDRARRLGRYQVVRKLGRGGMGTVYLARHALLRRPAAVKVLEGEAAMAEAATRFEREVQVTSTLEHPNTIQIFDYGHVPDGAFYYAMEYVKGLTLQALVEDDGPQPEARVFDILCQAAGSLAEAHRAGIIHRDVKPSNLMLCERGGIPDFVKVLDFGLVRSIQEADELTLTTSRDITGSPLYMAPEALENPKALDARGDVYQLGAVAYFLLTGDPPFKGDNVVEVLVKHLKQRVPPPSEVSGRPISKDLERLVLRCLEKDPDDRFSDAGALLTALEALEPCDDWTRSEAAAWWKAWTETHSEGADRDEPSLSTQTPSGWGIDLDARTWPR